MSKGLTITVLTVIAVCLIITSTVCVNTFSARADDVIDGGPVVEIGYDLGEYQAVVEYKCYILPQSGIYFEFVITLDDDFYRAIGEINDNVFYPPTVLEDVASYFAKAGYLVESDSLKGRVVAKHSFSTLTDYYIANGITGFEVDNGEDKPQVKKGFYFTTTIVTQTPFKSVNTDGTLMHGIYMILTDAGVERDKIGFKYHYGTPYKTVKAADADASGHDDGYSVYVYTFKMNVNNADRDITLIQTNPNPIGWYVTAVIIALPFIVVPFTIMIVKKRKNKGDTNA